MPPLPFDEALYKEIEKKYGARLHDAVDTEKHPKKESYLLIDAIKDEIKESIPEEEEEKRTLAKRAFERLRENIFRDDVLNKKRRPDGRGLRPDPPHLRAKWVCCLASTARRFLLAAKRKRSRP